MMVIITMDIPGASKVTLQYSMVLGHRRGLHGACTPPARVGSRRAGAWQEGARPSKLLGGVQQLVLSFVQEEEEHGSLVPCSSVLNKHGNVATIRIGFSKSVHMHT